MEKISSLRGEYRFLSNFYQAEITYKDKDKISKNVLGNILMKVSLIKV